MLIPGNEIHNKNYVEEEEEEEEADDEDDDDYYDTDALENFNNLVDGFSHLGIGRYSV